MRRALSFLLFALLSAALSCGRGPELPGGPRWVSLAPSTTETLFALGAGGEVVGVCAPAEAPPEAAALPQVAGFGRLDVEGIMALRPDAVFGVEGMHSAEQLAALRRARITVRIYPAATLEDLYRSVRELGGEVGRPERGQALEAQLRAQVEAAAPPPGTVPVPAAVVVSLDPLVVAGGESYLTELLAAAGFENVFRGRGEAYPTVSLESLAVRHPRCLIFPEGDIQGDVAAQLAARLNRLLDRPAVVEGLPADLLVRPGPRTGRAASLLAEARARVAP